jgi:hypothetical protein
MKTKIMSAAFLLLSGLLYPTQAVADEEYPVCQENSEEIRLTLDESRVEIELKPNCWSSLIIISDYATAIDVSYSDVVPPKFLFSREAKTTPYKVNGAHRFAVDKKQFRLLGVGKVVIKAIHYLAVNTVNT